MSGITLLLLIFLGYLCFKSLVNIVRDAFGGVGTERTKKTKRKPKAQKPSWNHRTHTRPIEKGEGEYVDFEDV